MAKKTLPREDLLSVEEAADRLQITEREVFNLIKNGKLGSEKINGRRWISRVEVNRYRLIFENTDDLHRAFSPFPSRVAANFRRVVSFGPWRAEIGLYRQYELEVTVEEWVRLVAKRVVGQAEYEDIRAEVRARLGRGAPANFAVRFTIDQASLAKTLEGVVHRVKIPRDLIALHGSKEEVRSMALQHLIDHTLLRLNRVKGDPSDYLAGAVTKFYVGLLRKAHPEISFGGPDEVEVQLKLQTRRLMGRKPNYKPHK